MLKKKIICLAAIPALLIFGCSESAKTGSGSAPSDRPAELSTPAGMCEYLKKLPAVEDARIWQNEYAPGIRITTDHYEVYTTLIEPLMLRQIPALVEAAYKAFQRQLPSPVQTDRKFDIYLFALRSEWEQFTREHAGRNYPMYLKIKKGAYYLNGACVAYNIGRNTTFGVLTHEAWHQFNSRTFMYRLPSWLDEGIATTLETPIYKRGKFSFPAYANLNRLGGLRKTMLEGNFIPLKHLIALNPGYVISDSANVMAFYSQAYALVRFLREDEYGKRLTSYHNLLLAGLRGNWPLSDRNRTMAADRNIPLTTGFNAYVSTKLFSLYIGEDIEQIEKEYRRFCTKLVYHVRLGTEIR